MGKLICNDGTEIKISDETEQELRKAFGPKKTLRHGDYGFYHGTKTDPCVVYERDGAHRGCMAVVNRHRACDFNLSQDTMDEFVVKGNIFDDLKKGKG